jgi:hypothetical protein
MPKNLDSFTSAYIETALWSSTDDNDNPLNLDYNQSDIALPTLDRMIQDCAEFQHYNAADIAKCENSAQAGHDFWLTRNGHGGGFWDRGLGDAGKRLTEASHTFGEFTLSVEDNGEIHGE